MKKLKVLTIVGTRPELIRLSRIIPKLDRFCDHILVHTGQNFDYELNQIFFDDLGIKKPNFFLEANGGTASENVGKVISTFDPILEREKPDAILVLGDTNSALSVYSAKRRKIPIFHMEAGNRCNDQRVPEEINRKIIDHIADVNLPYSSIARENLLREGLPPDLIIKTGSPLNEVLTFYRSQIESSDILKKLQIKEYNFFLVSFHREENINSDSIFLSLVELLNEIFNQYNLPIIFSAHPRTLAKIELSKIKFHENIRILKPLGFFDYNHLQSKAKAVLSDSGSISEESAILNFPALNLRETHERLEAMEQASVIMTGLNIERIFQALKILDTQNSGSGRNLNEVTDYKDQNVSEKIVRIIHSYTDYINRAIWKKY
jgi:UDP-N-acetylglucosamine 2-epimerase (non-hydrolysing)